MGVHILSRNAEIFYRINEPEWTRKNAGWIKIQLVHLSSILPRESIKKKSEAAFPVLAQFTFLSDF